ncbi:MAG TPA: polymer-forming cytoskeletal protein [Thermoanaerobaculia bacterium]|nr:polymer-forming cytoskeletal protein [Thermoanaerobaculia bacterium]
MSIFRRDQDAPASGPGAVSPAAAPTPSPSPAAAERRAGTRATSQIAPGTRLTGQINGTSDLVVDGELEGRVQLESHVTVGPEGQVRGDIVARSVRIGGRVIGNVQGTEKVEILTSGRLEGDVIAPRVVLAEGAFFKGKVEMSGSGSPVVRPTASRGAGEGSR